jgi:hypothetical protein
LYDEWVESGAFFFGGKGVTEQGGQFTTAVVINFSFETSLPEICIVAPTRLMPRAEE